MQSKYCCLDAATDELVLMQRSAEDEQPNEEAPNTGPKSDSWLSPLWSLLSMFGGGR